MSHHNLVHKTVPILYAMKISDANAAVDKEWRKLKDLRAWKVKSKERCHRADAKRRQNSSLWTCATYRTRNENRSSKNTVAASYNAETL